jgi:hypothetical protein
MSVLLSAPLFKVYGNDSAGYIFSRFWQDVVEVYVYSHDGQFEWPCFEVSKWNERLIGVKGSFHLGDISFTTTCASSIPVSLSLQSYIRRQTILKTSYNEVSFTDSNFQQPWARRVGFLAARRGKKTFTERNKYTHIGARHSLTHTLIAFPIHKRQRNMERYDDKWK